MTYLPHEESIQTFTLNKNLLIRNLSPGTFKKIPDQFVTDKIPLITSLRVESTHNKDGVLYGRRHQV